MKISVTVRKGKHAFSRAGLGFTANPVVLEVVEKVTDPNSQITPQQYEAIAGEAMLVTEVISKEKAVKEDAELSGAVESALDDAGVSVDELKKMKEKEILKIKGIGKKSLKEIKTKLF